LFIENEEGSCSSPACAAVEGQVVVECCVELCEIFCNCVALDGYAVFVLIVAGILAPDSALGLACLRNVAVAACLADELLPGADADQSEVVVVFKLVLYLVDGVYILGMCGDFYAEILLCGSGLNYALLCLKAC